MKNQIIKTITLAIAVSAIALCMEPGVTPNSASVNTETYEHLIAVTLKDSAATIAPSNNVEIEDHYGNPDSFIQYIIRKPPIHS